VARTPTAVPTRGSGSRTLTESLRERGVEAIIRLLELRPDLADPVPNGLPDLAALATSARSVARALDALTAWQRQAAEALAALPDPTNVSALADLLTSDVELCRQVVDDLRQRALVWGPEERLHLVRSVREQFGPYPGALAPPSPNPLAAEEVAGRLAACDGAAAEVLDRLAWSPTGAVADADRTVLPDAARSPIEQLLASGLLRPLNSETVILPREVAWQVRQGRFSPHPVEAEPPPVGGRQLKPATVDSAAVGAAYTLAHDLELVGHVLETRPLRLLRAGGLGQRDVASVAKELGADASYAGFVLECGAASVFAATPESHLLPTKEFDDWLRCGHAERWRRTVFAWFASERLFSRSLQPDSHPLGPEAEMPYAATLRHLLLQLLQQAGAGVVPDRSDLAAAVRWHRPRLGRVALRLERGIDWFMDEAGRLGLLGIGGVSRLAQVAGTAGPLPAEIIDLFPEPVDEIIIQADLTAVAAGPLRYELAAEMRSFADQESRGGGGVYRFSGDSLRRGLDSGRSAQHIRGWLEQHSTSGVPQPLAYLLDEVARHHGSLRLGAAESYLTSDDPVRIAALLADPRTAALRLRQLAPGVVVADASPEELSGFLRRLGHHAASDQSPDRGEVTAKRAPVPERARCPSGSRAEEVAAIVLDREAHTRRRNDPVRRRPGSVVETVLEFDDLDGGPTEELLQRLHRAVGAGQPVGLRLVTADGAPRERRLSPLDLNGGQLRGIDLGTAEVVAIPLARIAQVRVLDAERRPGP
jgi:hypothetical protein